MDLVQQVFDDYEKEFGSRSLAPIVKNKGKNIDEIVGTLKMARIEDAKIIMGIRKENKEIKMKIAEYDRIQEKIEELSVKLETLTRQYIETEQMRTNQTAQIEALKMELEDLKKII